MNTAQEYCDDLCIAISFCATADKYLDQRVGPEDRIKSGGMIEEIASSLFEDSLARKLSRHIEDLEASARESQEESAVVLVMTRAFDGCQKGQMIRTFPEMAEFMTKCLQVAREPRQTDIDREAARQRSDKQRARTAAALERLGVAWLNSQPRHS